MSPRKSGIVFAAAAALLVLLAAAPGALAGGEEKPDAAQTKLVPLSPDTVADIQRAIDEERYLDAGNMLDQALLSSGGDPRLLLLAGKLGLARGRYAEALASFKQIESDAKLRAGAREGEGIALSLLGRSSEAIPALQEAVAEDPSAWRAWNALGVEYDRKHDWTQAQAAYDHALSDSDNAPIVLNNRGYSLLLQNRVEDGIKDFVTALQKKPDFASARNNLRLAIAIKGDYDRSVSGANVAERAAALNNAGFAAMLRGDYTQAENLFGLAMKAKGDYYARAAANLETTHSLEGNQAAAPEKHRPAAANVDTTHGLVGNQAAAPEKHRPARAAANVETAHSAEENAVTAELHHPAGQ
ncbi:MAG TPA: tetratricopeptide repeat protein [Rhizomicrobium sp.]|jgi:Flp pilus assembly protein TadD